MTNTLAGPFYILSNDLDNLRVAAQLRRAHTMPSKDVDVFESNGITVVKANGRGISLLTETQFRGLTQAPQSAWKLLRNSPIPRGLHFSVITRRGADVKSVEHYLLCPAFEMVLWEYIAKLEELALSLEHISARERL